MTTRENKPWNSPDFERRFKEAMGRKMTSAEREFFGLEPDNTLTAQENNEGKPSTSAKFAWQALQQISALLGSAE